MFDSIVKKKSFFGSLFDLKAFVSLTIYYFVIICTTCYILDVEAYSAFSKAFLVIVIVYIIVIYKTEKIRMRILLFFVSSIYVSALFLIYTPLFYIGFKKIIGITPTMYIRELRNAKLPIIEKDFDVIEYNALSNTKLEKVIKQKYLTKNQIDSSFKNQQEKNIYYDTSVYKDCYLLSDLVKKGLEVNNIILDKNLTYIHETLINKKNCDEFILKDVFSK